MLHYDRKIKLSIVVSRRIFLGFFLSRIKHFAIIVIRGRLDISGTFLNKKNFGRGHKAEKLFARAKVFSSWRARLSIYLGYGIDCDKIPTILELVRIFNSFI